MSAEAVYGARIIRYPDAARRAACVAQCFRHATPANPVYPATHPRRYLQSHPMPTPSRFRTRLKTFESARTGRCAPANYVEPSGASSSSSAASLAATAALHSPPHSNPAIAERSISRRSRRIYPRRRRRYGSKLFRFAIQVCYYSLFLAASRSLLSSLFCPHSLDSSSARALGEDLLRK
ncbi:hypothetical protein C8J57DRAFT_180142 [Mycena rebaudengoi]|nr:hypothetical protein C8J57DRAFT_180142 [Mycena rebaudengoi]